MPDKYKEDVGALGNVEIILQTHAHFEHLNLNDMVALAEKFDKMIDPKYVIPAHYGVFDVMDQTPEPFLAALNKHAPHVVPFVLEPDEVAEF